MAQVSADGQEMLVMVNNLSGDVRDSLAFSVAPVWQGAQVARLNAKGVPEPQGTVSAHWTPQGVFAQMQPEFFLFLRLP